MLAMLLLGQFMCIIDRGKPVSRSFLLVVPDVRPHALAGLR